MYRAARRGPPQDYRATSDPNRFHETDCRDVLYVYSVQAYRTKALPETFGTPYQKADTVFFSDAVNTGCG